MAPAIVAVGFDRPASLERLLTALRTAAYPPSFAVPLVISLDRADSDSCLKLAEAFEWPHGPKRVIFQEERRGLREHILRCGDLTREYDGIILFEDDILPGPHFYAWVQAAFARYAADDRIGGVALYSYRINEFNKLDFSPVDDGADAYFLQVAASWGQAWTAAQWDGFRRWYAKAKDEPILVTDGVPRQLQAWRSNSWKRFFIKYLVVTGRTFVYPRAAHTTNMADPGTNTRRLVGVYQTPLDLAPRAYRLVPFDDSLARYDVFSEILPDALRRIQPRLADHDFDVDLFSIKPPEALSRPLLLSSRPARGALLSFGLLVGASPAAAIAQDAPGRFLSLAPRESFERMGLSRQYSLARATQAGDAVAKLLFQRLKPMQSELAIWRSRRQAARG